MAAAHTEFYERLGVAPGATPSEIRRAYKRKAIKLHPDRNPAPDAEEQFQALEEAYRVLSDADKRRLYDRGGEAAVRDGDAIGSGGGPQDMFSALFGMGGGGGGGGGGGAGAGGSRRPRGEQLQATLPVTLAQVYSGDSLTFRYPRKRLCLSCNGRGGRQVQMCQQCDGKGMVMTLRQLGPSMFARATASCPECGGRGRRIDPNHQCADCSGEGLVSQSQSVEAHIERGMQTGSTVMLHGMGHESSDKDPGDLVIKLEVAPHPQFKRQRDILIYLHTLTLHEALLGYDFVFTHLDGRKLRVTSPPGEVTAMNARKVIHEEGMPIHGTTHHGNLVLQLRVEQPPKDWLTPARRAALAKLLPPPPAGDPLALEAAETPRLVDFDPNDPTFDTSEHRARAARTGEAYESDEDRGGGGGGGAPACVPV